MTPETSKEKALPPLRPDECIQKILISTPSRFVGELETENLLLTHAWQGIHTGNSNARYIEGPASRSAYVLIFRTEPYEKLPGVVIPNYSGAGPLICSYLSVFFGKRFDNHGLIEGTGQLYSPDQSQYLSLSDHRAPHNSYAPRRNLEIPLNLSYAKALLPLLQGPIPCQKMAQAFQTAASFYSQALHNRDDNPEIAYLHLISAMEIVASFYDFKESELLDEQISDYLRKIETEMSDGKEISNAIRKRMFSIRRKVLLTTRLLLNSKFYETHEAASDFAALKKDQRDQCILAAYDLRSRYVHTGVPFGTWVSPPLNETQVGEPIVKGKEYSKILYRAPTLLGLERMVRYCLLRFLHLNGVSIHSDLDDAHAG